MVTGGAGYIGVHTIVTLIEAGYDVTVVDNLVNSSPVGLERVVELTGCSAERVKFHKVDMVDAAALEEVFKVSPKFHACIHFAGLKAVGESVRKPLLYYTNNLDSTINLLHLMDKYGCKAIVFSSSATVYGSAPVPIREDTPTGFGITNAYGRTKYMIEEILKDFKRSKDLETAPGEEPWSVVTLRYFNPVGSHPSGRIGESSLCIAFGVVGHGHVVLNSCFASVVSCTLRRGPERRAQQPHALRCPSGCRTSR